MTSVAATSAAAEEASEQLAQRRKEREQAAGRPRGGRAYITDAASMALSPSAQLRNAGRNLWGATTKKFSRRSLRLDPVAAAQVERSRQRLKEIHGKIIEPTGWFMGYWDGITFSSLIFTAVVTPVEVAFSGTQPLRFGKDYHELPLFIKQNSGRRLHQRLLHAVLHGLPGRQQNCQGQVEDREKYLSSWAPIDFISSCPLEMFLLLYQWHDCSNRNPPVNVASESCSAGALKNYVKIFRLLRLLKLFRVIRASRILKRWEAAAVLCLPTRKSA